MAERETFGEKKFKEILIRQQILKEGLKLNTLI
jgi:hypothetical protein